MTKKILKFGGTSIGSIERIKHAAKIVQKELNNGDMELEKAISA